MTNWLSEKHQKQFRLLVPLLMVGFLGYSSFVFTKIICVNLIDKSLKEKSTGIGLIVVYYILLISIFINWSMILIVGPGVLEEKIPPYKLITYYDHNGQEIIDNHNTNIPDYFLCDINGYPYYCADCQSIKPLRTRHSHELGKCVAKMDHYCIWIASIVGKANYKNFIQFVFSYTIWFIYSFVVSLTYTPQEIFHRKPSPQPTYMNPNIGIFLIVSFFWVIILLGLFGQHIWYISRNETTIEHLQNSRRKKVQKLVKLQKPVPEELKLYQDETLFVNFKLNDQRFIVEIDPLSLPFQKPSFSTNFLELFPTYLSIFIPTLNRYPQNDVEKLISPCATIADPSTQKSSIHPIDSEKTKVDHTDPQSWLFKESFSDEFTNEIIEKINIGDSKLFKTIVHVTKD